MKWCQLQAEIHQLVCALTLLSSSRRNSHCVEPKAHGTCRAVATSLYTQPRGSSSPCQLGKVRGGLFKEITLPVGPRKSFAEPRDLCVEGCVPAISNTLLLLSEAYPQVQTFVRHAQSLGHIHHPMTTRVHFTR